MAEALRHVETLAAAASKAERAGEIDQAIGDFEKAAQAADAFWQDRSMPNEDRRDAARWASDCTYRAAMAAALTGRAAAGPLLERALKASLAIFEAEDLEQDVRLHGLYRAQCAAFELGHQSTADDPDAAERLFRESIAVIEHADDLPEASKDHKARLLANGAAASRALASLVQARGDRSFRSHLDRAAELGTTALDHPALPKGIAAETMLVVAEARGERALVEEDRSAAIEMLEDALAWAREATAAPGADAVLQGQAMLRGANLAVVYGLYVRVDDFPAGLSALRGAVELALTAGRSPAIPITGRASGYDVALRTWQNIGLLQKELDRSAAADAFEQAVEVANEALSAGLPAGSQATAAYLGANACLERAILCERAGDDDLAVQSYETGAKLAATAAQNTAAPDDTIARACLIACGIAGRQLRLASRRPTSDEDVRKKLETIERYGQQAAHTQLADAELRTKGAFFAADAARQQANQTDDPRGAAEARQRAEVLEALQRELTPTVH